jgi:3-hydroxyisobutyrate dehydrogenase-like beta-hydroxyacid dehydrogenase
MIGLGIMGMPMSANMLKDGIMVYGYGGPRSNAEKIAALEKLGGKGAQSPREVAEKTDIVYGPAF